MPPVIPDKIPCDTESQLQREIEDLRICLDRDETEETWDAMQRSTARFKAIVRGGAYRHDSFVPSLRPVVRYITGPLLSERGRLSAVAIELVSTLASALGRRFEPLMHGFAPTLMKLCQRPNKVVITRTHACITTIIKQTNLPSLLPFLRDAVKDKSVTLRNVASESAYLCMTTIEEERLLTKIPDIEQIIKVTSRDPNPEVRKHARAILQEYKEKFPDRYQVFVSPLTPVTRKYLDIKALTQPSTAPPLNLMPPPKTSAPSKPRAPPERPSSSMSTRSSRNAEGRPASALRHATLASLPPRPQSATLVRPRMAPTPVVDNVASAQTRGPGTRPLSVDASELVGYITNHRPAERPRSMLSGLTQQRVGLQQKQSQGQPAAVSNGVAFPSSSSHEEVHMDDPRRHQRNISVTDRRDEAERAKKALHGMLPKEGENDGRSRPESTVPEKPAFIRPHLLSNEELGTTGHIQRPVSVVFDSSGAPFDPHRPNQANASNVSPSASKVRPQVVYMSSTEVDPPPKPKAVKTWSLSYQLEMRNKRRRGEDTKVDTQTIQSPKAEEAKLEVEVPAADVDQAKEGPQIDPQEESPATTGESAMELASVATNQPSVAPTTPILDPVAFPSTEPITTKEPEPVRISELPRPASRARVVSNASSTAKLSATSRSNTRPIPSHVSKSSVDMNLPVRVPSRNGGQPQGFVPKRTTKQSITQPTKSQAARAQVLKDEKEKATSSKSAATKALKPGQTSSKPKPADAAPRRDAPTPISFEPKNGNNQHLAAKNNPEPFRPSRVSKKPPIPTVASLVKAHAAKREVGLAQVKHRLGGAAPTKTTVPPSKRAQLAGSMSRKPALPKFEPKSRDGKGAMGDGLTTRRPQEALGSSGNTDGDAKADL